MLLLEMANRHAGMRSAVQFDETVGRYGAVGVTDLVVHWPRPSGPFAGDAATFEQIFGDRSRVRP